MTKSVTQSSVLSPQHLFVDMVVELLHRGERVRFLAPGGSMHPTIRNNEVIGVEPVEPSQVKRGDIILYRNGRGIIAHRVVRIANERPAALRSAQEGSRTGPSGLEERELRSLEGNPSSVSAPQTQCSSNGALAECSLSELLERSGRFESLASSEALLKSRRRRDAPQAKRSSNEVLLKRSVSGVLLKRSARLLSIQL